MNNIEICEADEFIKFIDNLSKFILYIYDNFFNKYESDEIFIHEKYNENQANDINLISDFFNFITRFRFAEDKNLLLYINIWNDTFKHVPFENITLIPDQLVSISKEGENMIINVLNEISEVKNIDNYYIRPLLGQLNNFGRILEDFELEKFLRMNKYDTNLYI